MSRHDRRRYEAMLRRKANKEISLFKRQVKKENPRMPPLDCYLAAVALFRQGLEELSTKLEEATNE